MKFLTAIIFILFLTGCQRSELQYEKINNCQKDADCVITATRYCGEVISINKDFQDQWLKEKYNPTIIRSVCLLNRIPESRYGSVCKQEKCIPILNIKN